MAGLLFPFFQGPDAYDQTATTSSAFSAWYVNNVTATVPGGSASGDVPRRPVVRVERIRRQTVTTESAWATWYVNDGRAFVAAPDFEAVDDDLLVLMLA